MDDLFGNIKKLNKQENKDNSLDINLKVNPLCDFLL
jgi:hypothetical protein